MLMDEEASTTPCRIFTAAEYRIKQRGVEGAPRDGHMGTLPLLSHCN